MVIATERRRFPVLDPADGSVIDSLESAGPDDATCAVDAAAEAAEDWASRAPRERASARRSSVAPSS
jgi:succinate-semialdehyde dehydrogenase/glutarate-semialdehyde dehydrogenase